MNKGKKLYILVVVQGSYGKRIVNNISSNAPKSWIINIWQAPIFLPPIIEEPQEFLPQKLPQTDLLLSLGESPGVAELIPDLAKISKAKAVIAPSDNPDWLPSGLKNQIKKELEAFGVSSAFPSPFCSLHERFSENRYIKLFSKYFGRPKIDLNYKQNKIDKIVIQREAPCGCTRFIAKKLVGVKLEEAEIKAALFHHYYPCLASGKIDWRIKDSLLHQSANITKIVVKKAIDK